MERIKPRTLSGFMELLPAPQTQFERMLEKLRTTYSLYGFTPLDTPIIESAEILLAKGGGETEKQIYRFTKGDSDLALRFDLTVPLAKYVALHYADLAFPFRRYQIGKVYRGERAQRGRFREFYQCDIDVIGDGKLDISNEAEIPAIIYQAFTSLGLERFKIRVNNRKILTGFYAMQGLAQQSGEIMRTVDKLDKIGPEKVRALLIEGGVAEAAADEILKFIAITGENEEVLAALEGYRGRDPIFDQGLDELGTVVKYLGSFGVPADHFAVDLTIARGLDYYTGTVYETVMLDHPEIGSICSGGRYDNLAEYYTDKQLPGVGISIGLTRLFYVLGEQGYLNDDLVTAPADALILPMTEDLSAAIAFATQLRQAGVRAQVYGEQKKFKGKMSYADKLKIPYVVFLGEDEIKSGVVKIKDMTTGDQQALSPAEAVQTIADAMAQRAAGKPIRAMKMKREGAVGLILIAILVVVMLVFLRGKSLEDIMGSGYSQADVTEITATLTGADETLTTDFAAGDQGYLDLISLLQEPSYSRTFTSDDSGALDYAVTLTFTGSGDQTWEYAFQGGKLIHAGVTGSPKTYQISGGQDSQQKILDFLLTPAEP